MQQTFRICPTNALVIEWRAPVLGARWCFYKVCDSKPDAQRSLAIINGEAVGIVDQMELLETNL